MPDPASLIDEWTEYHLRDIDPVCQAVVAQRLKDRKQQKVIDA